MMHLGDFAEDATVRFGWSTNGANGAAITRATNGTVSVYKDGGTTQSTAGVTDTEDFDGVTGVHLCTIDTSADAFYAAGSEYMVVLSGATVDGQSVAVVLAHFSIARANGVLATLQDATVGLAALEALVDELESRLTATRAGYLDNLSAGAVATAAALSTLDGYLDTEIAAILAAVDTEVAAIATSIGTPAGIDLATDIANLAADLGDVPTAAENAAGLLDLTNGVESGVTLRQALRAIAAVAAGKVSGMDTGAPVFRNLGDTANRVSATTDADGNRSAVTLNL